MPPSPPLDPIRSPPPALGEAPIEIEHLARMTLGDEALRRQILAMFLRQADELLGRLATFPRESAALAHTLKGSARAIGAFHVAACAEAIEGAIRERGAPSPGDLSGALARLKVAVGAVRVSIEGILALPRTSVGQNDPL
jgi:HPt (histidine-containing phosphotransfer) domain-containing protein